MEKNTKSENSGINKSTENNLNAGRTFPEIKTFASDSPFFNYWEPEEIEKVQKDFEKSINTKC